MVLENTKRSANVGLMLNRRRKRWANIKPTNCWVCTNVLSIMFQLRASYSDVEEQKKVYDQEMMLLKMSTVMENETNIYM